MSREVTMVHKEADNKAYIILHDTYEELDSEYLNKTGEVINSYEDGVDHDEAIKKLTQYSNDPILYAHIMTKIESGLESSIINNTDKFFLDKILASCIEHDMDTSQDAFDFYYDLLENEYNAHAYYSLQTALKICDKALELLKLHPDSKKELDIYTQIIYCISERNHSIFPDKGDNQYETTIKEAMDYIAKTAYGLHLYFQTYYNQITTRESTEPYFGNVEYAYKEILELMEDLDNTQGDKGDHCLYTDMKQLLKEDLLVLKHSNHNNSFRADSDEKSADTQPTSVTTETDCNKRRKLQ